MANIFGRQFQHLHDEFLEDLRTTESEGCVYSFHFQDNTCEFSRVRVKLRPGEIVRMVDGAWAYEEFNAALKKGCSIDAALQQISELNIRHDVERYNQWARKKGQETEFCYAAFMGLELEALLCTTVEGRTEVLGQTYTADRQFLLMEIVRALPFVSKFLTNRDAGRPSFAVENEQDIRDLLFSLLKPVFPDALLEDPTSKDTGSSKRVDIVIPKIKTLIEMKIVRNHRQAKNVGDELKIDIESYHRHPDCDRLLCVVWDPDSLLADKKLMEEGLSGQRQRDDKRYGVQVVVLP